MSEHTPGPWEAVQDGEGYWMIAGSGSPDWGTEAHYDWLTGRIGPSVMAVTHRMGVERTAGKNEDAANARLIAAAPDLLEAAKSVLVDLNRFASRQGPGPDRGLAALQAAIAKAEGR